MVLNPVERGKLCRHANHYISYRFCQDIISTIPISFLKTGLVAWERP